MVAFKEKNPGNVSGVIPYGYSLQPLNPGLSFIPEAFKPSNLTEEQFATLQSQSIWLANWSMPGFDKAVQYVNKMYNASLISPNFATDKDGKLLDADISNGKVGAFQTNWDGPYRTAPGTYANLVKMYMVLSLFQSIHGRMMRANIPRTGTAQMVCIPSFLKQVKILTLPYSTSTG